MTIAELKEKTIAELEKTMFATEEERLAIFKAYMRCLVEDTAKWLKENNYFMGE